MEENARMVLILCIATVHRQFVHIAMFRWRVSSEDAGA